LQKQRQALALKTVVPTIPRVVHKPYISTVVVTTPFTLKPQIPPFVSVSEYEKQLKKAKPIEIFGKGYRIRKWKVPKMKEAIPVPNIKKLIKKKI